MHTRLKVSVCAAAFPNARGRSRAVVLGAASLPAARRSRGRAGWIQSRVRRAPSILTRVRACVCTAPVPECAPATHAPPTPRRVFPAAEGGLPGPVRALPRAPLVSPGAAPCRAPVPGLPTAGLQPLAPHLWLGDQPRLSPKVTGESQEAPAAAAEQCERTRVKFLLEPAAPWRRDPLLTLHVGQGGPEERRH